MFSKFSKAKQKKCHRNTLHIHCKQIGNPAEILEAQKEFYHKLSDDYFFNLDCMNYTNAYVFVYLFHVTP